MINIKKIFATAVCCVFCTVAATACGEDGKSGSTSEKGKEASGIVNYIAPEKGDEVIVMTIKDRGDVKIKLFEDEAEKGVENFVGLAKDGYYDGLTFHRIINEFMIQGGDPLGNGTGGESIWGDKFEGGTSENAIHLRGAIAYANSGATSTNGSQFYIVTGEDLTEESFDLYAANGYTFTEDAKKLYMENGGTPFLDGGYTVFGQVYEGLDIVMDIQTTETDENDKPVEDVIIEKVTVEEYDGEDLKFHMSDYE